MKKIIFFICILLIACCAGKPEVVVAITQAEQNEALQWVEKSYQSVINHQWAETIRTSSAAIALNPNLSSAYINRALAYTQKGLFSKAIEDCNKALEIENDNAAAYNNRGLAYSKLGADKEALKDYRKACELGLDIACNNFKEKAGYFPSEEVNFLLNKSIEEFSAGNYELAIDYSTRLLEIEENNERAFSIRCGSKANLGLLDEAEKDCLQAIKINPDFSIPYTIYGAILEKKGEEKLAAIYYEISCGLGNNFGCENNKRLLSK